MKGFTRFANPIKPIDSADPISKIFEDVRPKFPQTHRDLPVNLLCRSGHKYRGKATIIVQKHEQYSCEVDDPKSCPKCNGHSMVYFGDERRDSAKEGAAYGKGRRWPSKRDAERIIKRGGQ